MNRPAPRSDPSPVLLLPNIGSEEPPGSRSDPIGLAVIAALWARLFAHPRRLLDPNGKTPPDAGSIRREEVPRGAHRGAGDPDLLDRSFSVDAFPELSRMTRHREGRVLVAWLPDRAAAGIAGRRGCRLAGPPVEVVAKVHDKGFATEIARREGLLPPECADTIEVLEPAELEGASEGIGARRIERRLARWPEALRARFTLKPRHGTSGRGRVPGSGGELDGNARRAIPRLARQGGAILEPWFDRTEDFSVQLWIEPEGEVRILGTTRQRVTESGIYCANAGVISADGSIRSGTPYDASLIEAARKIGRAAAAEGFWGPCGIDAFVYRTADGTERLRPVVELNARFTTGTIALGLLARARALAGVDRFPTLEDPGRSVAWAFHLRGGDPSGGELDSARPTRRRLRLAGAVTARGGAGAPELILSIPPL